MNIFHSLVLAITALACLASHAADRPPNIVVILADDFGWGDTTAYRPSSTVPTPAIDRLAKEGVRCTRAHAPAAVCSPSRYGLLTGRYPWRSWLKHNVVAAYGPPMIREGRPTLASFLKTQGYHTAGFGKWHIGLGWDVPAEHDGPKDQQRRAQNKGPETIAEFGQLIDHGKPIAHSPLTHGFDTFFGTPGNTQKPPVFIEGDRVVGTPALDKRGLMRDPALRKDSVDDLYATRACQFITQHQADTPEDPFFIYLAFNTVHVCTVPPERYEDKTGLGKREDKILWLDENVGEVLDTLDELQLTDDTLVIFTSDNGPDSRSDKGAEKGSKGADTRPETSLGPAGAFRGHKCDVWEGGTRVPLMARWPGRIPAGSTSDQLIGLTDIMATLAAVLDAPLPEHAGPDSVNQLPALLGQTDRIQPREPLVTASQKGYLAIHHNNWKAIFGTLGGGSSEAPADTASDPTIGQLYDLARDPSETTNLWDDSPELVQRLRGQLEAIQTQEPDDPLPWLE